MSWLLSLLTPLVDTTIHMNIGTFADEGDIPVWMATVSGDTILVSDGRYVHRFLFTGEKIYEIDVWSSPVAFDDMVLRGGKLYALSRGNERVYVFDDGGVVDSILIPYGYISRFLYMFRTAKGIYLDLVGDSSYSILDGRPEPDPVIIKRKGNWLILKNGGRTFRLPEGVVSASFIGEDGRGKKYILVEGSSDSGVEMGVGMLKGGEFRIKWLGQLEMDGYISRPMELNGGGLLFMFIPYGSDLRILIWNADSGRE